MKKGLSRGLIAILIIGIVLLGFNFYSKSNVNVKKKDVNYYSGPSYQINLVSAEMSIDKVDENGDPQDGVAFKLRTNNDFFEYNVRHGLQPKSSPGAEGYYYVDDYDDYLSLEEVESVLTEEQLYTINSIKTADDLQSVFGNNASCYINETVYKATLEGEEGTEILSAEEAALYTPDCAAMLPTVFTLEETKVPEGYARKKVLIPGVIYVYYNFVEEENGVVQLENPSLSLSNINVYSIPNGYYMEYGEVSKNELMGIDIIQAIRLWRRYGEQNEYCTSNYAKANFDKVKIPAVSSAASLTEDVIYNFIYRYYECPIYLMNEKGEVVLELTSSVNNEESITTDIDKILEYKVSVKNKGTADAVENVITAKVPEGFVLVEDSISDRGVYHDGVIEWNIDKIERGSELSLTYQAYAPKGVNAFQSYVGEASIENFALEGNKIEANKTYVKLSLTNPYTYAPIGIVILIIVVAGFVLTYTLGKQLKQK